MTSDRQQVTRSGARTAPGPAAELDVAALIFRQAAATPEATAVSGEASVSYRQFAGRAARLAHHLRTMGVGPDTMVAVALDRSVDQLVAALAALAAGGAYVPLDPSYPARRLSFVLDNAEAPVLVTRSDLADVLPGAAARTVLVDRDADVLDGYPATPPVQLAGPDHLAYVIYTSGSTGHPKGAMNTRRGLLNRLVWMQRAYRLTAQDAVLQKTPVGFDVSVWECYGALIAGARTVVARPDGHRDPHYLAALIGSQHVTVAHFVPSMLRVFLDTADLTACGSLRKVLVGGEVLTADLQQRFFASGLRADLDNVYGPAETAIDVTRWHCRPDWEEPSVPIGGPVANTRTHVLDGRGRPVPEGAEGELCLGGVQVGRGYLGQPALTAERFVPDSFSAVPGARLYCTGDRARLRTDGALDYLGRLDDQVKLRGVRIELGEIEAVLAGQPGVRGCAVAVRGDGPNARLVGYVVGDAAPQMLRAHLAEVLPEPMVPAMIVPLDELPLSANGKLDRRNLPEPVIAHSPSVATDGSLEHSLAEMWGALLGVPVGLDVEFTALGGNSLHAAQILTRIRTRYGVELSFREIFEARTVDGLALLVSSRRDECLTGQPEPLLPPVCRAPGPDVVPSLSQQRLWFLDHLRAEAGVAYNVPVAARLHGPLSVPALKAAINDVVRRHEQLRTSFLLVDGRISARVEEALPAVQIVDLRNCPDPELEAMRQAERLAATHIDLGLAPLLRCAIFRVGEDDHLMVAVFHHMVADGWTVNILDRDLAEAYHARIADGQVTPPDFGLEYRDYARWQHGLADSRALTSMLDYWRSQLADAPTVLELPADHPRPAVRSHRGGRVSRRAPRCLPALRRLAAATRTTPYAVCLATFGTLLRELTGMQDFLVASPAAGRPDLALENVAGFFANTVLVRLRPGDMTFRQLVEFTHQTALDALEHQYVPFERLAAEFAPARDLSRPPLAQVALAYQGRRRPYAELTGLKVQPAALDNSTAKFDLTIELHEVGDELEVSAEYCTDLFEPERAEGILGRFLDLLATAAGKPDLPLTELASGPALDSRGDWPAPQEQDLRCLHEIFAATAARWPDRVAVTDGARHLSYKELDQAANRLAHRLQRLGADPEQLVGLCAERTVDVVVGVLAVLKSGAGYLPLDPRHPAARLDLTLADADCQILLGDAELCGRLIRPGRVLVRLGESFSNEPDDPPPTSVRAENVAYVIYTSGSTGVPKGVMVSHANVVRLFTATEDEFGFGPDDVWTLFHSVAFDFSVWEIWGALLHGGRLIVVSHVTSREPSAFLDLLCAEKVTVLNQTPTAFSQLADAAENAGFPVLCMRVVVFGGEALDPATLRRWVGGYGTARPRLVNMYGITETAVHVTIRQIDVTDLAGSTSPIGRPIGDLRAHVLDKDMVELPAGEEGEMYVGGAGVSRGYLGRPAQSAERFVPDPFGRPGERLYRTGDLVVRRPDGELEFRGRADAQIKLHGFRIELGEIERALLDQPCVHAAACMLREDRPGLPRLVAYLVLAPEHAMQTAEIRSALLERLPEHMVPAVFVAVPALPLSGNGKLDRALLPAPPGHLDITGAGRRIAPRGASERTLARVWSQVLGVDEPDVSDNFFTLGGDSIVAIRMAAAARAAGLHVTVEDVFLNPTIARLAAGCTEGQAEPASPSSARLSTSLPDLDPAGLPPGVIDAYPTAAMQLGILVECELADDSGLYHDLISVHLAARFDRPALERALATVCARHEILRTSFNIGKFREPMQLVYREAKVPVTVEDHSGNNLAARSLDTGAHEAALREWWAREKVVPFDLARPPLIRCHVLLGSTELFQLSLSVHHTVLDGWSLAQLMTELLLDYDAQLGGTGAALAPMPLTQYKDFIAAEQAAAGQLDGAQFWNKLITSSSHASLPVLPRAGSNSELVFQAAVPAEVDAKLRQVAGELGIPLKSIFFAAHLWALQEITARASVASGLQVNCRLDSDGADRLLGVLLNIVPVHLTVHDGTWAELAEAAFAAERKVQPFRRFPLAKIQRLAGRSRKLFEVVFNYTDFHIFGELDNLARVRTLDWWFSDTHSFPLVLGVSRSPRSGCRAVDVTTGTDTSMAGTGSRLGELVIQALYDIARTPHALRPSPAREKEVI